MKTWSYLWVLLLATSFGCRVEKSSHDVTGSNEQPQFFDTLGVGGTWQTACVWQPEKRLGFKTTFTFSNNRSSYHFRQYGTESCPDESLITDLAESTLDAQLSTARREGWTTFNYLYESVTFVIQDPVWAHNYNDKRAYERDDWKVGEARDISGRRFQVDRPVQPMLNLIYERTFRILKAQLVLGELKEGTVDEASDGNPLHVFHKVD